MFAYFLATIALLVSCVFTFQFLFFLAGEFKISEDLSETSYIIAFLVWVWLSNVYMGLFYYLAKHKTLNGFSLWAMNKHKKKR